MYISEKPTKWLLIKVAPLCPCVKADFALLHVTAAFKRQLMGRAKLARRLKKSNAFLSVNYAFQAEGWYMAGRYYTLLFQTERYYRECYFIAFDKGESPALFPPAPMQLEDGELTMMGDGGIYLSVCDHNINCELFTDKIALSFFK